MDEFLKKYNGRSYPEADNERQTPDWKIFGRDFINFIKRQFPGCDVQDVSYNYFEIKGTLLYQNYIIFFNWDVPKVYESKININDCSQNPIIHCESDFHHWNYSSLSSFKEDIKHYYIRVYDGT